MLNKKLFPGITHEEMLKKEQEEIQCKIAQEKKEQQAKKEAERQSKRKKYALPETDVMSNQEIRKDFIRNLLAFNAMAFLAGSFLWTLWGMSLNSAGGNSDRIAVNHTPYAQALRDAYVPISNGKTKKLNQTTYIERGKFAPTIGWTANMLVMLMGLIGATVIARRQKMNADYITLHNDTVDMMLDLEDFKGNYNLNTYQVARMINNMSGIIREMSEDKRIYFDMILDGRINIRKNDTFLKMATHIMQGHLAGHPNDINKILDVYNWQSVPFDLLTEYDKYIIDKNYRTR